VKWRPSPALVIACIALFVSMGGVSYAVATGSIDTREIRNNTIRSGDVRNNALRTQDIRNNEVRGFDVRNSSIQGRDVAFNTLTGADIAESSLGKVASATSADSAATVASVRTFAPRVIGEGSAPVTIATHGPLTLTAACVQTGGGDTAAQLRVQSTQTGAAAGTTDAPTITPASGPVVIAELPAGVGGTPAVDSVPVFASAGAAGMSGTFGIGATSTGSDTCTVSGHIVLE
jgi:hypothetical protein